MIIREAVLGDELAVADLHVRGWQAAYRGLLPQEYLDGLLVEERAARYDFTAWNSARSADERPQTLVVEKDGNIIGFAMVSVSRDEDIPDASELCALYVDPLHWGIGAGRELINAARARMTAMGHNQALLWVLEGNRRAEEFYAADGWVADGSQRTQDVLGVVVQESRWQRRGLEARTVVSGA